MGTVNAPVLQRLDTQRHSLDQIIEVFRHDGAVVVENMLSPQVLRDLQVQLVDPAAMTEAGTRSSDKSVQHFWGAKTKRFTRLAWRSKTFLDNVLVHPILGSVADEVLLPFCSSYWMNTGQMIIIGPGEQAQYLHRDADNWRQVNNRTAGDLTVSCMFAITDFDQKVGATRVVVGSQAWQDRARQAQTDEVVQAIMPAGSGLIYSGNVIHGGGANTTVDQWRQGLHLSYVVGWLTPEEAGCLGMPQEIAQQLTPRQQQLLGYRCYQGDAVTGRLWTVDYEDVPVGLGWKN